MRETTCAFTGHRILSREETLRLGPELERVVERLAGEGYDTFCAGGALGFDTLAARAALAVRRRLPGIRLRLILPCLNQASRWNERDAAAYEEIKAEADEVIYTSQAYTPSCMAVRNRRLVDECSLLVCYLNRPGGGTAQTVRYAQRQGVTLLKL